MVVKLSMEAKTLPDADSFNTVAEIKGWQHPEQVGPPLMDSYSAGLFACVISVPDLKRLKHVGFPKKASMGNKCSVQRKHALLLRSFLFLNLSVFQSSLVW